ncbi:MULTISPECIES: SDR family oxidoreductase [Actinosynnema]|uniref:Short-chain dehydrogenase n=1 Tax=Actinosynnema pretiosum TaxID=42197 RepID=A0A290ZGR7_9PSEU|nr:SDR family oxidoreductase [Actinosynnema pretiosum]ATE58195.1 short-chain dehydrogenase [Actinosynnema pretiosum]
MTGASRGIGRAVAERLGAGGAAVAVHYRADRDAASEVVARIEAAGGVARAFAADLAELPGVTALADEVRAWARDRFGRDAVDVLVNNAGIGCPGDIAALAPERFDLAFAVNVRAPVFLVQRLLPALGEGARIVNVSSLATRAAHPRILGYAMSKGALDVFGRALADQLGARGVTVNTVAPGLIDTDFHGDRFRGDLAAAGQAAAQAALGRIGEPADVADVIAFLVSPGARWVTGERVEISGGTRL